MNKPTRPSWPAIVGWSLLAALIGLIAGSVLGYMWSNAQIHTTQTGYMLRGDHRGVIVIGHAVISGLAGAIIAAVCTVVGLVIRRKRGRKNETELDKHGDA